MDWSSILTLVLAAGALLVSLYNAITGNRRKTRKDTIGEYAALLETCQEEIEKLKADRADCQRENRELRDEVGELRAEVEDLRSQLNGNNL